MDRIKALSISAQARWGARATHRGNFQKDFGIDVDCYVLDDSAKTAVISQRGMGAALGLGVSGSRIPDFVKSKRMADYVGRELREKLANPLIFQAPSAGGNSPPPSKVNGYDVTVLVDLCKAVVAAESDGRPVNPAVAKPTARPPKASAATAPPSVRAATRRRLRVAQTRGTSPRATWSVRTSR